VNHPFSDASGAKVRPGVVVQNDARNVRLTETIVALISSNVRFAASDSTQVLIDPATPDGKKSGLYQASVVKCGKLFTIDVNLIRRKVGVLSAAMMQHVNDGLKLALELP
jgi:mRNA-degrading endonuclease toxin of MazEF toxin-antitoxin module